MNVAQVAPVTLKDDESKLLQTLDCICPWTVVALRRQPFFHQNSVGFEPRIFAVSEADG